MLINGNTSITDGDLYVSAFGMANHLKLIEDAEEGKARIDPMSETIGKIVNKETKALLKKAGFDA